MQDNNDNYIKEKARLLIQTSRCMVHFKRMVSPFNLTRFRYVTFLQGYCEGDIYIYLFLQGKIYHNIIMTYNTKNTVTILPTALDV